MQQAEFFSFDGTSLNPCSDSVTEIRLAAADSFLIEDGKTRSLAAHFERFGDWARVASHSVAPQLPAFFEAATAAFPRTGRWFPRLELHLACEDSPEVDTLYLRLREAPELLGDATLWTLDEADPRLSPAVKGPDLSLCMQLRRRAQMHGADEAVILNSDGFLSEGALSALVWWRGDVLCAPNHDTPWLHSITRDEVFAIARSLGYETRIERVKPSDLVGLEIWALSSLQGIRPVVNWVNLGSPVGAPKHLEAFQKRLRLLSSLIG